jgi:hypothetical protein
LSISPRSNHIATVNEGKAPTVFVNFEREFNFECKLKHEDASHIPVIEYKPAVGNTSRLLHSYTSHSRTERSLNSSWLTALNPINYENVTVQVSTVVTKHKIVNASHKTQNCQQQYRCIKLPSVLITFCS